MKEEKKNPTTKDVYLIVGEIKGLVQGIREGQDRIADGQTKVILALIGVIGATLGLKAIGSPPLQVCLFYIKVFVFLFTALVAAYKRNSLGGWYYLFAFAVLAGMAQITNIVLSDEEMVATILFLAANIALLAFVWNWDRWLKKEGE